MTSRNWTIKLHKFQIFLPDYQLKIVKDLFAQRMDLTMYFVKWNENLNDIIYSHLRLLCPGF